MSGDVVAVARGNSFSQLGFTITSSPPSLTAPLPVRRSYDLENVNIFVFLLLYFHHIFIFFHVFECYVTLFESLSNVCVCVCACVRVCA
jgi:hypothetical protein